MPNAIMLIEYVVWQPGDEWQRALDYLAGRFERVSPLNVSATLSAGDLVAQMTALRTWQEQSGADIDRELGRYFDENLAMQMRPNPTVTRAVRARAAHGELHAASALPERAAESIARHCGVWRSLESLTADISSDADLDVLRARVGADGVIASVDALSEPF